MNFSFIQFRVSLSLSIFIIYNYLYLRTQQILVSFVASHRCQLYVLLGDALRTFQRKQSEEKRAIIAFDS